MDIAADNLLPDVWPTDPHGPALSAYLLGRVEFDDIVRLQRRLHFDISGERDQAALILCEHPPLITVGRHGSARHISIEPRELFERGWPVRWVKRGGGCWLHLPGQLNAYLLAPLDRMRLGIRAYLSRLADAVALMLRDFSIRGQIDAHAGGVAVNGRLVAASGIAVHDWVTTFGLCLNIGADLENYHRVRTYPLAERPMTSLERERRGLVRPSLVRQRVVEHVVARFGFSRVSLFTEHSMLRSVRRLDDLSVCASS